MERGNGAASSGDLPWASVFDPAANVRALTAIQAEGLRAATGLVDRFIRIAATGLNGMEGGARESRPEGKAANVEQDRRADLFGAPDVEPLLRSWLSMVGQLLPGTLPDKSSGAEGAALDFSGSVASGRIELSAAPGGAATAEVWLHNLGRSDLGPVRLRCADLLAPDGATVPAGAVRIHPAAVPMPARSSRGVELTVQLDATVAPGWYRGTLLAQGYPQLWLPVGLRVCEPGP